MLFLNGIATPLIPEVEPTDGEAIHRDLRLVGLSGGGHGSGQLPIKASEQLAALINQCREVVLDDTPDELVVDGDVLVGELVAEADDPWCLLDLSEQGLVALR